MLDLGLLSTGAVALVSGLLAKGAKTIEADLSKEASGRIVKLYDTLKAKLTGAAASEALAELEKTPTDGDAQAAVRQQVKKALAADEDFREQLRVLVEEIKERGGDAVVQMATTIGDHNVAAQVSGQNNVVNLGGKN